jgi:AbrB family looped-hinge helix DNA binding protein
MVRCLTETTYHKDKVYLPKEVRETMGLTEGDRLRIEVLNEREARIVVIRSADATKRMLGRLENPPDLGRVMGRLTRREIYEDNP